MLVGLQALKRQPRPLDGKGETLHNPPLHVGMTGLCVGNTREPWEEGGNVVCLRNEMSCVDKANETFLVLEGNGWLVLSGTLEYIHDGEDACI